MSETKYPHPAERDREIKVEGRKFWGRIRGIALTGVLLGGAGFFRGPQVVEFVQTQMNKRENADPEKTRELAQRVLDFSETVEKNPQEIFEARLDVQLRILLDMGEDRDRVMKTQNYFREVLGASQQSIKNGKDIRGVIENLIANTGRYEPDMARISNIVVEKKRNCEGLVQGLILWISALYPDLKMQVQFFRGSKEKQSEPHTRLIVLIDEKWYAIEDNGLIEIKEQDMKGTVVTDVNVFETSLLFSNNKEKFIEKTGAKLLTGDTDSNLPSQNDDVYGGTSNTPFDLSVFTNSATATYGPGGGESQPESDSEYKDRIRKLQNISVELVEFGDLQDNISTQFSREQLQFIVENVDTVTSRNVPGTRGLSIHKGGLLSLDEKLLGETKNTIPRYDFGSLIDSSVSAIKVYTEDKSTADWYYYKMRELGYNITVFYSNLGIPGRENGFGIKVENSEGDFVKTLERDTAIQFPAIRRLVIADCSCERLWGKEFENLESLHLGFVNRRVLLPTVGNRLGVGRIEQSIIDQEDLISLNDLSPLFNKQVTSLTIMVKIRGTEPSGFQMFTEADLKEKGIIESNGAATISVRWIQE